MKRIALTLILAGLSLCSFAAQKNTWAPAGDKIKTVWAEQIDPNNVWAEYPRPQMIRGTWQNLNGLWNYAITPMDAESFSPEGQILVPFAVESSLSGVQRSLADDQALWYERTFTVPSAWKGKDVILHFGAVDWQAEVWVNGQKAGIHKGGYTAFSFNITPYLKKSGKQTLRVKVLDATDHAFQPRGKQWTNPRSIWYTPVSGIWQTVWMEPVAKTHICSYEAQPDVDARLISVKVNAENLQDGDKIRIKVVDGLEVVADGEGGNISLLIPDMKLWSPDSPFLYQLNISIERDGAKVDSIEGYTACRKISVVDEENGISWYKRLALNNESLFQFGPLDQGWWPDGLYTAPCDEALKFDIVKTKEMGFNMIRKHTKVEPARWYYWCDVLGILVWQDMPAITDGDSGEVTGRSEYVVKHSQHPWYSDNFLQTSEADIPEDWKANYYNEWGEIINEFKHFQSIVVWVPFNEAWGQFDTKKVVEFTRAQDPTRLVNESSGGNYYFCGDIIDIHHYPQPAMNSFTSRFVMVLGEYGGIGRAIKDHTWFNNEGWGYGGLKDGMEEAQNTYVSFTENLKTFVQTGCSAAVYTQTTDCEGELNGLMTYDRKVVKFDEAVINKANTSVIESMK